MAWSNPISSRFAAALSSPYKERDFETISFFPLFFVPVYEAPSSQAIEPPFQFFDSEIKPRAN